MIPILVGYLAKEPLNPSEAARIGPVRDIASVPACIVSGADGWEQRRRHNEFWRFDSERLALSLITPEPRDSFSIYA